MSEVVVGAKKISKKALIELLERTHSDPYDEYSPPVKAIIEDLITLGLIDEERLGE